MGKGAYGTVKSGILDLLKYKVNVCGQRFLLLLVAFKKKKGMGVIRRHEKPICETSEI